MIPKTAIITGANSGIGKAAARMDPANIAQAIVWIVLITRSLVRFYGIWRGFD